MRLRLLLLVARCCVHRLPPDRRRSPSGRAKLLLLVLACIGNGGLNAQGPITSAAPDRVAVTIYRDPDRSGDQAMTLNWLNGFAFISEQRRVSIPEGESQIRFEGVAAGTVPESAIVTGLPDGVIEKNEDAELLSPATLLGRSLGQRVHLRRTSRRSGAVREQDAIVRSGPDGAVVLQTAEGFEALRCSGIPETLIYDRVPDGLSSKPTLSIRTRSSRATDATITLSYLASGFDWQANYVGTLSKTGDRMDLFAWVTIANGDETSFVRADAQTVAGRLNRTALSRSQPAAPQLSLTCWPSATTSDIESHDDDLQAEDIGMFPAPAPPPPPPAPVMALQRAPGMNMKAVQEELGDLKLYRIPEPVTVAAKSQKQVAMLDQRGVKVDSFYRGAVLLSHQSDAVSIERVFKMRNRKQEGLGLPLPAGGVILFQQGYARPVLIGDGSVEDHAVGEDVEFKIDSPPSVHTELVYTPAALGTGKKQSVYDAILTVSSDLPRPVRFDAEFESSARDVVLESPSSKLERRNGKQVWSATIPANGTATFRYRLVEKHD